MCARKQRAVFHLADASLCRRFSRLFRIDNGSIGLYLGDVSGKGLPAAMYAALAVGTLRGVHKIGQPGLFFFVAHKKSASVKEHCEFVEQSHRLDTPINSAYTT
jgi:Stage II sporulation protein E (SpoIIE)